MRWTRAFIPTLRDDPADAEAASHKLLIRGGFARQLMSGVYALLPLGQRVAAKVEERIRREIAEIGGQEFTLPALHPAEVWQESGRWDSVGEEMFRLRDRHGTDVCLGLTHEEIFTWLSKEMRSYKELPQLWFQFQTKFRDEARPKSGLLRVREFVMKDSYSFDLDEAGLDRQFKNHFDAYRKIFERCGLEPVAVEASSGAMGGDESVEFMVKSEAGEDWIASCSACGYAANVPRRPPRCCPSAGRTRPGLAAPEKFATPGQSARSSRSRAFGGGAPLRSARSRRSSTSPRCGRRWCWQLMRGDQLALVLMRGDHDLSLQKWPGCHGRAATPGRHDAKEIRAALGAAPGKPRRRGGDAAFGWWPIEAHCEGRSDMVTGANEDDFHLRGVDVERDLDGRRLDSTCAR